jgi:hypothetical protein
MGRIRVYEKTPRLTGVYVSDDTFSMTGLLTPILCFRRESISSVSGSSTSAQAFFILAMPLNALIVMKAMKNAPAHHKKYATLTGLIRGISDSLFTSIFVVFADAVEVEAFFDILLSPLPDPLSIILSILFIEPCVWNLAKSICGMIGVTKGNMMIARRTNNQRE